MEPWWHVSFHFSTAVEPVGGYTTLVSNTWQGRRQAYGHLPSFTLVLIASTQGGMARLS